MKKHTSYNPNHLSDLIGDSEFSPYSYQGMSYPAYDGYDHLKYQQQYNMHPGFAQYPQDYGVYNQGYQNVYYQYPPNVSNIGYPHQVSNQNIKYQDHGSPYSKMVFYSPKPTPASFDDQSKISTPESDKKVKPASKLSTKSPHAIAGHKFNKQSKLTVAKNLKKGFSADQVQRTPPFNHSNGATDSGTFEQICDTIIGEVHPDDDSKIEAKHSSGKTVPEIRDKDISIIRKSTFDDTENCLINNSASSFSSPQERDLQMRIVSSFKLNPFPFDNFDDHFGDNFENADELDRQNAKFNGQHYSEFTQNDDELFNVFPPFLQNDAFQIDQQEGSSSGPIFSLMSNTNINNPT